jgi:hypothetical protein
MTSTTIAIINTSFAFMIAGLFGFLVVRFFQMRKEIARNDLDREMDMIYRSIDDLRSNLNKDVESLTNKIDNVQNDFYTEMDRKFRCFSTALNDADRRIDEITNNNLNKEPTLYDNVP